MESGSGRGLLIVPAHGYQCNDGVRLYTQAWLPTTAPETTVVLLHGLASNATRWHEYATSSRLRHRVELLAPDLRGHGYSVDYGPQSLDLWADDVAALLDDRGRTDAVLVGHCLGAAIAQRFAQRHPNRLRGMILIEPLYPDALRGPLRRLGLAAPVIRMLIGLLRFGYRMGVRGRPPVRHDLEALDRQTRRLLQSGASERALRLRYGAVTADIRRMPAANYLEALLATVEVNSPPADWTGPVLSILARRTRMAEMSRTEALLARFAAGDVVHLDAEHWLPAECPDALRETIDGWVERCVLAAD